MTPGFKPFTVIQKTGDIQLTDYQQPCTNLEKNNSLYMYVTEHY